jgi:hypothetical protein
MKKIGVIIGVLIILSIVGISGCTSSGDANSINVSNLKVSNEGYGTYYVTCDIVPNQDIDYLEMVLVWYDSSDAVIERTSLAWNIMMQKKVRLSAQRVCQCWLTSLHQLRFKY